LEPLLRQVRLDRGTYGVLDRFDPLKRQGRTYHSELAAVFGVPESTIESWLRYKRLTAKKADYAACRIGLHPLSIWPDWRG
jgi:hypothetical protein